MFYKRFISYLTVHPHIQTAMEYNIQEEENDVKNCEGKKNVFK